MKDTLSAYQKRRIRELERDIKSVEDYYYSFVDHYDGDPDAQIFALRMKREFLVRALIMEQHLSIEDLVDVLLKQAFLKIRLGTKPRGRDVRRQFKATPGEAESMFSGNGSIGFKRKIVLLRLLGIISKQRYEKLEILNSLRNKCGHQWTIEGVARRRRQKGQPKRFVLAYQDRSLFEADNLVEFLDEYRVLYLKLVEKAFGPIRVG